VSDIKERLRNAKDEIGESIPLLEEAAYHIAQLEAMVAANREDAERYAWVKKNADIFLHREAKFSCDPERYCVFGTMPCHAEIDCAIDYGMADTSTQEAG
tara:strand:- start:422521 stop:422820 length:300 start_codon:yes stop_codon:yes gene_type:complete